MPNVTARAERTPGSLAARAFLFGHRAWLAIITRVDTAFIGGWLGVLSRTQLHAVDEIVYRQRPRYRSDEHNRAGLFAWEVAAMRDHFANAHRIAVLGAGGGREVLALARLGFLVDGFECNTLLVASAQQFLARERCAADVHELPRDAVPDTAQPYDGVVLGWSAYMLVAGRARRIRLLRGLHAIMRPNAPLLLSFFTRPEDTPRLRAIARMANVIRRALGRERVDLGDDLVPNFVHHFTADELCGELRDAGFALLAFTPQRPGAGGEDSGWAVASAEPQGTVSA